MASKAGAVVAALALVTLAVLLPVVLHLQALLSLRVASPMLTSLALRNSTNTYAHHHIKYI